MKKVYSAPQIVTSVIEKEDILTTSNRLTASLNDDAGSFFTYKSFMGGIEA